MTLPSSGALAISQIVEEFGGAAPHSLSEYYGADAGIPSSGPISISQFYGKSNIFTLTIAANSISPNIPALAAAAGWNGSSTLVVNITAALINALRVESSWTFPSGLTINISSTTRIGGVGGGGVGTSAGVGGTAIYVRKNCTINNLGVISAGGGSGGQGAWARSSNDAAQVIAAGGAGGQGQGFLSNSSLTVVSAQSGANGETKVDSFGGGATGGRGGNGGAWGSDGSAGGSIVAGIPHVPANSGALSGFAVDGNTYITWQNTGTRLGRIA